MKEMQSRPQPPPPRDPPVRLWRQPAKFDLYSSDSESSSEVSETESDSSDEEKPKNVRNISNYRKGLGVTKSAPKGGSKNDLDMKRNSKPVVNGKRNFSSDSQLTTRSERPAGNNRNHATATKVTNEMNQLPSRFDRVSVRPKSNTPDSSKGKPPSNKPIRRTVSDRNIKCKVPGASRPPLQRSNSAKTVNEKESSKTDSKVTEIKKSSSDSKCDSIAQPADSTVLQNRKMSNGNHSLSSNRVRNGPNSSQQKQENSEVKLNTEDSLRSHPKPPLPQNQRNKKPPLNPVNSRPYGFSAPKKLPHRPSAPANLVREKFFYKEPETSRPVSAEMPRIAYRHSMKPSYDARIFAIRVSDGSSESSDESSSDESCG